VIYSSEITKLYGKVLSESGRRSIETEVYNFKPRPLLNPRNPPTPREFRSFEPEAKFKVGSIEVRSFPVDHSVAGATAFLLECSDSSLVYTGDLRLHGPFGSQTRVAEVGYEVRGRIDPIVPIEGWKDHYAELVRMMSEVPFSRVTLGTLRGLTRTIVFARKLGKDLSWAKYFSISTKWGKKLSDESRYEIYSLGRKLSSQQSDSRSGATRGSTPQQTSHDKRRTRTRVSSDPGPRHSLPFSQSPIPRMYGRPGRIPQHSRRRRT